MRRDRSSEEERHEAFVQPLKSLTPDHAFELAVAAGIYTEDGQLTPPYRSSEERDPDEVADNGL